MDYHLINTGADQIISDIKVASAGGLFSPAPVKETASKKKWKGGHSTKDEKKNTRLINAQQVAEILGISVSYAYKLIDDLNNELSKAGYLTIRGKVDSKYLQHRFFPPEEELNLILGGNEDAAV